MADPYSNITLGRGSRIRYSDSGLNDAEEDIRLSENEWNNEISSASSHRFSHHLFSNPPSNPSSLIDQQAAKSDRHTLILFKYSAQPITFAKTTKNEQIRKLQTHIQHEFQTKNDHVAALCKTLDENFAGLNNNFNRLEAKVSRDVQDIRDMVRDIQTKINGKTPANPHPQSPASPKSTAGSIEQRMANLKRAMRASQTPAPASAPASASASASAPPPIYLPTERFRAEDIGFFDLYLDSKFGEGAIVQVNNSIYYRNVHFFVGQAENIVLSKNDVLIKLNLHQCLRGVTQKWYAAELFNSQKQLLLNGNQINNWAVYLKTPFL